MRRGREGERYGYREIESRESYIWKEKERECETEIFGGIIIKKFKYGRKYNPTESKSSASPKLNQSQNPP